MVQEPNSRKLKALAMKRNDPNLEYVWEESLKFSVYGYDGFLFLVVTPAELDDLKKHHVPFWYDIQEAPVTIDDQTFLIFGVDDYNRALEELEQDKGPRTCNWCNMVVTDYDVVYPTHGTPLVCCTSCKKKNERVIDYVVGRLNEK